MSVPEAQILLALLSAGAMLSAAWLVLHARDVALLLRPVFPRLVPGTGRRLASFPGALRGAHRPRLQPRRSGMGDRPRGVA